MMPNREQLEAMKRADLVKMCKDYGVRANLKTEVLINMLINATQPPTTRPIRTRAVSRQRGQSGSSLIIHDTDEEQEDIAEDEQSQPQEQNYGVENEPQVLPKSRKGKDTQVRLGVGRPAAAGGSGARAVTTRGKRAKTSKALQVTEAPIEEEPEPEQENDTSVSEPGPSGTLHEAESAPNIVIHETPIDEALRPLREEIATLKVELKKITPLKAEVERMAAALANMTGLQQKYDALALEIEQLRGHNATVTNLATEVANLRLMITAESSKNAQDPFHVDNSTAEKASENKNHPGLAASTLGKRHRDPVDSDMTGVVEEGQEVNLSVEKRAKTVVRPVKKKPKIASLLGELESDEEEITPAASLRAPSFTVFTGYDDPPPPTNHLPEYYTSLTSSTAHESENDHRNQSGFAFPFLPSTLTSTPAGHISSLPSFPYPEPPSSPSPTHQHMATSNPSNRTDAFQAFGFPPPNRPVTHYRPHVVNPAMLTAPHNDQHTVTSDQVAAGLGLTRVGSMTDIGEETAKSQPTMYGTELHGSESDRFGDFGVVGVASGFWSSGGSR